MEHTRSLRPFAAVLLLLAASFAAAQDFGAYQKALDTAREKRLEQAWMDAAEAYRDAIEINPTVADVWSRLAHCLFRAEKYEDAIEAHKKVYELGGTYPWSPIYQIAVCYTKTGDKDRAIEWLQKAMDLGFRDITRVRRDRNLESLRDDPRFIEIAATADVSEMSRDEGWRYDLRFLAREIARRHYDPYRLHSKDEFDAFVKELHNEIPVLTDHEIEARLMILTRMAGDGHTRLYPTYARGDAREALPISIYLFKEGMYVVAVPEEHKELLGAAVLAVGAHPTDELMQLLDAITYQDNKMGLLASGPGFVRYPQILNGLGLISKPNEVEVTVKTRAGETKTVILKTENTTQTDDWLLARNLAPGDPPLTMKSRNKSYWFEYLEDANTVFFQYNRVRSEREEPFPKFCERLFEFIEENNVERLVIDIRWNGGGNTHLIQPLIHGLIKCEKINRSGKLFVIIGRNTFSAAMNCATDIDMNTEAIFVGEPTGSSPNFIGESVPVTLPYSKMTGTISDLHWVRSWPMDYRSWIAPTIYAPPSFEAYMANRDPAMEAILAYRHGG
ncbi:MAG: tetratricopeptide repeat protein [Armatimonadetes bacterium]|nr:tetratricopeptide repeat protein [Armatimonadota bacterium]